MIKIACCGMNSKRIREVIEAAGEGKFEPKVMSDMQGAMAVKGGKCDYYIGTCQTGGGGSLGMAMGLLGPDNTKILATPNKVPTYEEVESVVGQGIRAFGMPYDQIDGVVPMLVKAILKKTEKES